MNIDIITHVGNINSKVIHTSVGNVQLYTCGQGEQAIFFLHGAGSDSAMLSWKEVLLNLPSNFTAYCIDLLGHGNSDKLTNYDDFYNTHLQCLTEVIEQIQLKTFYLVGLSMGGALATMYSFKNSDKVSKLFLVNSWGFTRRLPFHRFSYWYLHNTNMTMYQFNWMAKSPLLAKWAIQYALIGNKNYITDELVAEVMQSCQSSEAGYAMQQFQRSSIKKESCYPYLTEQLHVLPMPIIFVSGDKDKLVPIRHMLLAKKQCRQSELHILKGCKHWAVKEVPERFNNIINSHM